MQIFINLDGEREAKLICNRKNKVSCRYGKEDKKVKLKREVPNFLAAEVI